MREANDPAAGAACECGPQGPGACACAPASGPALEMGWGGQAQGMGRLPQGVSGGPVAVWMGWEDPLPGQMRRAPVPAEGAGAGFWEGSCVDDVLRRRPPAVRASRAARRVDSALLDAFDSDNQWHCKCILWDQNTVRGECVYECNCLDGEEFRMTVPWDSDRIANCFEGSGPNGQFTCRDRPACYKRVLDEHEPMKERRSP